MPALLLDGFVLATTSAAGRETTIQPYCAGDMWGCVPHLLGQRHTADMRAVTAATVARFPVGAFARALEASPETCRVVATNIARGCARLARLRTLSAERSPRKIAGILLWLHESVGPRILVTQAIVATIACTTEETVSRVLAPLKRDGIIAYTRGIVEIMDLPRLRRRVEER